MRFLAFVFLLVFLLNGALNGIACGHGKLPVAFEPNQGQAPADVEYLARASGYTLCLRAGGAAWVGRGSRISATLVGARRPRAEAEGPLPGVVNYLGRDAATSKTGITTYASVRYRAVYPGIDVVYYGTQGRVEYDFLIAPGADPRQIRIRYQSARYQSARYQSARYQGARTLRVNSAGDLLIDSVIGNIRQPRPSVYQEIDGVRRTVAGRYELRGNTASFKLGRYDRTRPLVIDPTIVWASYFGSASADDAEAVAVDSSGNIYIAGATLSLAGDANAFIAKLNPSGTTSIYTTVFATQSFPASGNDLAHAIAVDSAGNAYIAGETSSADFAADTTYITRTASAGTPHVFISKVDSTGKSLVYSHYVAAGGSEIANGVALDAAGNAYIAGATNSPDFPVTTGVAQTTRGGGVDVFVMRFDVSGARAYATLLGGSGDDFGNAIAVDAAGDAFVTGSTNSSNFPVTSSPFQAKLAGGVDAFVAKLSPSGTLAFSTYLGGSGDDVGNGIAIDSDGAAYVAGETASSDFPTHTPFQAASGGGARDAFVAKLNTSGSALGYSTYFGGTGADAANAIALDGGNNAYITGSTSSTDLPLSNAFQTANAGPNNAVVAAFDPTGSALLFSSYLGGNGGTTPSSSAGDSGNAISMSCAAGLVVAGTTSSTNFPATAGVLNPAFLGGGSDAFIARLSAGGAPVVATGGVLNSASSGPGPAAPGSLVSVYGSSLGLTTQVAAAAPWGINLGGVTVSVNGAAVPIYFASPGQMNIQVPYETKPGVASITVTGPCGSSPPVSFQVAQAAPYIFQTNDGSAILQNQDLGINGPDKPAKVGSVVTVYLTGIGPLDNPVPTGAAAPATALSRATLPVHVTIGNFDTPVQFLGLTPGFVGLAQANLVVPNLSTGRYPIIITIGGIDSNAAAMYVQ